HDQHGNDSQHQTKSLELKVHEVRDDQGCLNYRKAEQDRQHCDRAHGFVGKKYFDQGQHQQPNPNRRKQLVATGEMFLSVCAHSRSSAKKQMISFADYLARWPPTSTDMM